MADEKQADDRRRKLDATDLTPDERPMRTTWPNVLDMDRGGPAEDTARPRDRVVSDGGAETVPGFTTTSVNGSMGGRALYGQEPKADREARQDEEEEG